MIKVFANLAAKIAAVFPTTESSVSLLEDTGKVLVDGRNNVTNNPVQGDVWCWDENNNDIYISRKSYTATTFPAAWVVKGQVIGRWGKIILKIPKTFVSQRFMAVYPYVVTGMVLDGQSHSTRLRLHGKPTTTTYYTFAYAANTIAEFVTQLQAFLTANNETDWSAYVSQDGQDVILQYDNYNSNEYYSSTITYATNLVLTARVVSDIPHCPQAMRRCGTTGLSIWNLNRAKVYFLADNSNFRYNPTSVITSVPEYPVCWPGFAGTSQYVAAENCAYLRNRYCADPSNPILEDWYKYLEDLTPANSQYGPYSPVLRSGKELADKIKDIKYKNKTTGNWDYLYTAVRYCVDSIEGGFLSTWAEHTEFFKDITWGNAGVTRGNEDIINQTQYMIGGTDISCISHWWVASRNSSNIMWFAYGSSTMGSNNFFKLLPCVPCSLSELPLGND